MKRVGLLILLFAWAQIGLAAATDEKDVPYGNNPSAGHYLQVGDAKIYYEIYGSGRPLVLLHGGLFGYIDEFAGVIPELSRHYMVIAIALRGHGKSELGQQPLSNALFAEDSAAVIRHVTSEPVDLIGFSTGAMASYLLTIGHPELVHKLIAVGGPIASSGSTEAAAAEANAYNSPAELEKQLPPKFVARRNRLYPDRAAWERLVLAFAKEEATEPDIPKTKVQSIQSPTLIVAGDQDDYTKLEHFAEIYHLLPHGELAIVPGCGHTVFKCNPNMMIELVERFFQDEDDKEAKIQPSTFSLDSLDGLEIKSVREDGVDPVKTKADVATYRGRRAVRIVNDDGLTVTGTPAGAQALAIVKGYEFKDGTIEADIVGLPREGAPSTTRGFVGIAFRVQDHGSRYESIYLRQTNGRAGDQLMRNHATQYVEQPDFTWQRLRKENPGVYESYVDLEPGAWTRIKIVVAGTKASLYVNDSSQPCLIVNDLKLGDTHGQVALWTGSNTEAYFSNLTVR